MPIEGHADDCACCVGITFGGRGQKRSRADADLVNFLPPVAEECEEDPGEREEEELEGDEEEEDVANVEEEDEETNLIHSTLFTNFDKHVDSLDAARVRRVEILSFKSALEDDGAEEINPDATQDEIDGLGIWQASDERQGDVNFRTLLKLLTRVDQRGFERSSQQLEACPSGPFTKQARPHTHTRAHTHTYCGWRAQFHTAFMKAAARVIYRNSWATDRPAIMKSHGWETSNSEVLIRCAHLTTSPHPLAFVARRSKEIRVRVRSTPRRFGKTFS